jgi:hypothetical protein
MAEAAYVKVVLACTSHALTRWQERHTFFDGVIWVAIALDSLVRSRLSRLIVEERKGREEE